MQFRRGINIMFPSKTIFQKCSLSWYDNYCNYLCISHTPIFVAGKFNLD